MMMMMMMTMRRKRIKSFQMGFSFFNITSFYTLYFSLNFTFGFLREWDEICEVDNVM